MKKKTVGNFTKIPNEILRNRSLSPLEFAILAKVLGYSKEYQETRLTIRSISAIAGCGEKAVSRALRGLVEKGFLARTRRRIGGGKGIPFNYSYTVLRGANGVNVASEKGATPMPPDASDAAK